MPVLRIGELAIDIIRRRVTVGVREIELSPVERSLLYELARQRGRALTRQAIIDAVWGPLYETDSNVVDQHIAALRRRLDDDRRKPRYIETVPGVGYRFIAAA